MSDYFAYGRLTLKIDIQTVSKTNEGDERNRRNRDCGRSGEFFAAMIRIEMLRQVTDINRIGSRRGIW